MPSSPTPNNDVPVWFVIKSDGTPIDDSMQVISVTVNRAINRVPKAEIVLKDGNMSEATFPASDNTCFKPGKVISVQAGYGSEADTIFSGIIIGQRLSIGPHTLGNLVVECRDKAVAMTVGRKNANFVDSKDSDIAAKLIGATSGLSSDVGTTDKQWKELVQYYCSDWDFLLSRAEVNGFVVIVDDGKVSFKAPDTSSEPKLKVTFGEDLIEFNASLDARDQFSKVQATAWDMAQQAIVQASANPQSLNTQGDLSQNELSGTLNLASYGLQTSTTLDQGSLSAWAKAQQLKSGLARLRGNLSFQGSSKAKVGELIEVKGVGNHFSGKIYVSSVQHDIRNGNWITEVQFGLSPTWYSESRDLEAPPASGLLPGIQGLHIGKVKKLDEDPDSQYRIQVSVPVMQAETEGVWARLMQFHATNGQGAFFVPEIGDEVVLGYFNSDPSSPVILGSLYSSQQKPAYELTADNYKKAISTKSELKIEFDDEKKIITLLTPGKNTIVINDDEKSILLQDQNNNKVTLGENGISLDSPKDITLTAQGNISMTATQGVSIKATEDATMEGMNVNLTANVGCTVKGDATAELSASGQTTIKGAMVMIN